jgi:hypothetical protein
MKSIKQVFYKHTDLGTRFCAAAYEYDCSMQLHHLSYTEGKLGEINPFEYFFSDNYNEIEIALEKIRSDYPDTIEKKVPVSLSLLLDDHLRKLPSKKRKALPIHFRNTVEFVSFYSGMGYCNYVQTKNLENSYNLKFDVIDKELFFQTFIEEITPCGLRPGDFLIDLINY